MSDDTPSPRPTGRPTVRTDEMVDEILDRISGGELLTPICRDDHMPARSTFLAWVNQDQALFGRYAHARELGYGVMFEDTIEIADASGGDLVEKPGKDGSTYMTVDQEVVQRSKLRIWARHEMLKRVDPRKYGERSQVAPVTPDGDTLPMAAIMFVPVEAKPPEDET
jgi:hypothetical protein